MYAPPKTAALPDNGAAHTSNVAVIVVNAEDAQRAFEIKKEAEDVIDVLAIEDEQAAIQEAPIED